MCKFNFNIDTNIDNTEILAKQKFHSKSQKEAHKEFCIDQYFVDMGLSSKNLWMKYNIGVDPKKLNDVTDYFGNVFAWGEIKPNKNFYGWKSYKHCKYNKHDKYRTITKYCFNSNLGLNGFKDQIAILDKKDDAAYMNNPFKNFDINIQTPSHNDAHELLRNSIIEPIKNYNGILGLDGCILTSKINGNQLFFPYILVRNTNDEYNVQTVSTLGWYMLSNLESYSKTLYNEILRVDREYNTNIDAVDRNNGIAVRAIMKRYK